MDAKEKSICKRPTYKNVNNYMAHYLHVTVIYSLDSSRATTFKDKEIWFEYQ